MENKNVGGGWCKASVVLGVLAVVIALLPIVSGWFMLLTPLNWAIAPLGIICGVVAIIKSQDLKKSIIGLALSAFALAAPFVLAEQYVKSAAESAGNAIEASSGLMDKMNDLQESVEDFE